MAEMLEPPFPEPDLLLRLLFWERIRSYGVGAGRIPAMRSQKCPTDTGLGPQKT